MEARKPTIEVKSMGENRISFILSGTDVSIANTLRKAMISEVPTIAIDLVEIEENTSMLADEFIAHRLGLLPLVSNRALDPSFDLAFRDPDGQIRGFQWHHESDEEANCEIKFEMDVRNNYEDPMDVTTHHLKLSPDHGGVDQTHCGVHPVEYDPEYPVVIAKLKKNQAIKLTAIAKKGLGRMHAKWSPASGIVFTYEPVVRLNYDKLEKLSVQQRKKWVSLCPPGLLRFNEASGQVEVDDKMRVTVAYSGECEKVAKNEFGLDFADLVSIKPKCGPDGQPDRFHFDVETNGALDAVTLVRAGLWELGKRLEALEACLQADRSRII